MAERPPSASAGDHAGGRVLLVCTANECRSVMAEAFLRRRLADAPGPVEVASAGFVSSGKRPPGPVQAAMRAAGLDVSGHRSRLVHRRLLAGSDLVVTMTRQHLVELAVAAPEAWAHCFTLAEALRRGEVRGPRRAGESLGAWVADVGAGRMRSALLTLDLADDVVDPTGRRQSVLLDARDRIAGLTDRLGHLLLPR